MKELKNNPELRKKVFIVGQTSPGILLKEVARILNAKEAKPS